MRLSFPICRRLVQTETKILPFSHFLTDTLGRQHNYLRISLTEKCNLRCTYCMPEDGVSLTPKDKLLSVDEILKLSKMFVSQGIDKIRLTGGEPTIRKDIADIVKSLKTIPGLKTVAMTTNGLVLSKKIKSLREAGLDAVNISLDTLVPQKYEFMTRRKGFDKVIRSIQDCLEIGYSPVKINVVVMKGLNDDEILNFVDWTKDKDIDVRFIEYMPFDKNQWSQKKILSFESMLSIIKKRYPNFTSYQSSDFQTSKPYFVPGFTGRIGFITSMTNNFCSSCNRLRITADGHLKVCLFGNSELDLRTPLRKEGVNEEEILKLIGNAVKKKRPQHAGMGSLKNLKNRPMILIGG